MGVRVRVGGVYSVARGQGWFGVVKVIAYQRRANTVYARTFGRRFRTRPDLEQLHDRSPGKLDEELDIGIGALPVTRRVFEFWEPQYLFSQAITPAEEEDLSLCFGLAIPWDDLMYP